MQFGLAFSYPFQDPDWMKKIGLVALLTLIPVVGTFVLMGWAVEICRRVIAKDAQLLPAALDFSGWLKKGFLAFVIAFVYSLPLVLFGACMGTSTTVIPLLQLDSGITTTLIAVVSICLGCVIALLSLAVSILIPAAMAQYAATDQVGAAFKLGEVFGLVRASPAAYAIVFLGVLLAGLVGGLGFIACCIGMLATMAYAYAVQAHLWGQAYLVAKAKALAPDA